MQSFRLKVYSIDGVTPVVDPRSFVHPEAVLISSLPHGTRWMQCSPTR